MRVFNMKKLIVKAEFVTQEYQAPIEGVEAVEAQPEKWVKGEEVLFEEPMIEVSLGEFEADTSYTYHPAIEAVEGVEARPEIPEVKEWKVIAQTQGSDEELAVWLSGDLHKYPEGYEVEYIDVSEQVAQEAKFQAAMEEINKGIKGIAVFKVRVKDKGLSSSQIAQLFASEEIKKIIETLSTGSLPLAAYLIANYQADGVIVTEGDKQAVMEAIG
jgi:hypothetical protein